ncbi:aldo/keto reductase [Candidatus Entotheonella serta]|nr:aldo/keto reductase [Candidatus Entotheonella serta]
MEYRQLGRVGVRVSVIGLGTNRFGSASLPQTEVNKVMDAAQDLGINFIDTADTYTQQQSEETLGHALKGRWDRFVVATKFVLPVGDGPNDRGASRYHMMHSVEASLRRLQSDHIDLYYIHRWEPNTPVEETLRGLEDLVRQGKIGYIGVSDFAAWQLAKTNTMAELKGWSAVAAIQSEYHLLERYVEQEILPYCQAHHVGFVPYYPLAGGFLTGKYRRGEAAPPGSRGESNARVQAYMTEAHYDVIEALTAWAKARDRGLNELAQAWLMAQPQVCSVISGATRLEHVINNAKAAEWVLSQEDVGEINAMLSPANS